MELGALVAFLSAQEKLYIPWKELIRFYQAYQSAAVTYKRTMDYYAVDAWNRTRDPWMGIPFG